MNVSIRDREFRLSSRKGVGICCDADGAYVDDVALLERSETGWSPRENDDLSKALGDAYGLPVDLSAKRGGLSAIAKALNEGDVARAQIATLLLALPDPLALSKSAISQDDVVALAVGLARARVLKYDQYHYPAHAPDSKGGQFAPDDEGGDASDSSVTGGSQTQPPSNSASVDKPDVKTSSSVFFGKPLTAAQFIAWLNANQNTLMPADSSSNYSTNAQTAAAGRSMRPDRFANGPNFEATPEQVAFMEEVGPALARFRLAGDSQAFERFIAVGHDADGNLAVTSLQILGALGGKPVIDPNSTAFTAHTHPEKAYQTPVEGDESWAYYYNKPSFVVGYSGNTIFEIGRTDLDGRDHVVAIRTVGSDPSDFGPWEAFEVKPERYRYYNVERFH
jgi:hypothetical protein